MYYTYEVDVKYVLHTEKVSSLNLDRVYMSTMSVQSC